MYHIARTDALTELYKSKELPKDRSESLEADFEEVAASCGHFSFSLYDFGTEMQNFLAVLEELKEHIDRDEGRSWKWLYFWTTWTEKRTTISDPEREPLLQLPQTASVGDVATIASERRAAKQWDLAVQERRFTEGFYRRLLRGLRILDRDDGEYLSILNSIDH